MPIANTTSGSARRGRMETIGKFRSPMALATYRHSKGASRRIATTKRGCRTRGAILCCNLETTRVLLGRSHGSPAPTSAFDDREQAYAEYESRLRDAWHNRGWKEQTS